MTRETNITGRQTQVFHHSFPKIYNKRKDNRQTAPLAIRIADRGKEVSSTAFPDLPFRTLELIKAVFKEVDNLSPK